jgi:hypothetical protein
MPVPGSIDSASGSNSASDTAIHADASASSVPLPLEPNPAAKPTGKTATLCPATVAELKADYPTLKLNDMCPISGCGNVLAYHARDSVASCFVPSSSASSSSSLWTTQLQKFVSGSKLPRWSNNSVCRPFLEQLDILLPTSLRNLTSDSLTCHIHSPHLNSNSTVLMM